MNETNAARNAWICGGAIPVVATLAMSKLFDREEHLNRAFGLWAAIGPWALGFANVR